MPAGWQLASQHVLTGVPENDWTLRLQPGVCLDFVPIGEDQFCVRAYGFSDTFLARWATLPPAGWAGRRANGSTRAASSRRTAALIPQADIQSCPLFPVLAASEIEPRVRRMALCAGARAGGRASRAAGASCPGSPRKQIPEQVNLRRLYEQRARLRQPACCRCSRTSAGASSSGSTSKPPRAPSPRARDRLPELRFGDHDDPMQLVHDQMFRSAVLRHRREPGWEQFEAGAFARLREMIVHEARLSPACPRRSVMEDQIVWARSPIRFDLAGGWTDTPPYCIEHGGKVLNVAADLNGQPPIQVFAKLSERPELVMRSIDLGVEERVRTYAELDTFGQAGQPVRAGQGGVCARRLSAALPRAAAALLRWSSNSASSAAALRSPCLPPCPRARAWAPAAFSRRPSWPRWATCADWTGTATRSSRARWRWSRCSPPAAAGRTRPARSSAASS